MTSLLPPPRRAEEPAPDLPKAAGYRCDLKAGRISPNYDFHTWPSTDMIDAALVRGMWL